MQIIWQINADDVRKVKAFFEHFRDDPIVKRRFEKNLNPTKQSITKADYWYNLLICLLTTQQRSGPKSAVTRFINTKPFPLNYQACIAQENLSGYAREVMSEAGGIRRSNIIAEEIELNLSLLETGLWERIFELINELSIKQTAQLERKTAHFISRKFKGLGPKQSRNLLQLLGLTKYEIPVDSRIVKWLNEFGFPVKLSATALSDHNYYDFVLDLKTPQK